MSCSNMTNGIDTYYVERANGRFEYWTYSDGIKVYVSKRIVDKAIANRDRIIYVK